MAADENDLFSWIDETRRTTGGDRALEALIDRFKRDKQYGSVFNARLMKSRLDLGLRLTSQLAIDDVPAELQQRYQEAYLEAAREVGHLLLADGNIPGAWPYFRAVGNLKPVAEALETLHVDRAGSADAEHVRQAIQIAFYEGVNPQKGFELALEHYGICRAITMFSAYPAKSGRDESLQLLVRTLHAEIVENLKRTISAVEGTPPQTDSIATLVENRGWLFESDAQYTDSSHLAGLLRFTLALEDEPTLRQAVDIADYGLHLSPMFQYNDNPPFDHAYEDRGIYLRALLGEDVERAVAHFESKAAACEPELDGTAPAEVLIELLCRLGRHGDAIRAFRQYLSNAAPEHLSCPTLPQLCELAGDFEQLKTVAKEQVDPLSYLAGALKAAAKERQP
jgi:tetratricopeptide (TPR) repeat protein